MILNRMNALLTRYRYWMTGPMICLLVVLSFPFTSGADNDNGNDHSDTGMWVAGDFHQHTTYTDGSNSFKTVMYKNYQFGLDWWANSEHGGQFGKDARGPLTVDGLFNVNGGSLWNAYPSGTIIGSPSPGNMWRWQSLRDFSFWDTVQARGTYYKPILQSLEWNVPGHEHCSMGNIANQFEPGVLNANPLAQFEYLFDAGDSDVNAGLVQGWTGKNTTNDHAKAIAAVKWLQDNYARTSYTVFAHVERKQPGSGGYTIADFRDFNSSAPDVCFGFESMPGHQKESNRGGYTPSAVGGGTFGGTGIYSAQVGGLWDALLGEGRNWWLFASSDFHTTVNDFWPGEYQKTHTFVEDPYNPQAIVDGLRSGNSFVVEGDLINGLAFQADSSNGNHDGVTMGQSLMLKKKGNGKYNLDITIRFRSPNKNNNGDPVSVDHIDLIGGSILGPVAKGTPNYNNPTNPTTQIIATFTNRDWKRDKDGWNTIHYNTQLSSNMYFRLRGTNLAPNTPNETDVLGNPLSDTLLGANTAEMAYDDLWFYSNPIFVYTR